jgi:hypothetical protein
MSGRHKMAKIGGGKDHHYGGMVVMNGSSNKRSRGHVDKGHHRSKVKHDGDIKWYGLYYPHIQASSWRDDDGEWVK